MIYRKAIRSIAPCAICLCLLLLAPTDVAARRKVGYYTDKYYNAQTDAHSVLQKRVPDWARSVTIYVNGKEAASQIDTIGGRREAVFLFDARKGRNIIRSVFSDKELPARYTNRTHAQMYLKNRDKSLSAIRTVTEGADTMYNRLHHHGPAFENELAAYRIYFDKKQTTDLYGKRHKGLELAETMWYPTETQLAEGSGDDVIRVFGSVGVGTLKGWDAENRKAIHIAPFESRTARIVASGPVRTVVEMDVKGWEYCGRKIDVTSRYTLWAGDRVCHVENIFGGDYEGLTFCTGVMKMAEHQLYRQSSFGHTGVWGTDYPQNDTLKYKKESVGIGVVSWGAGTFAEDDKNYLILLKPNSWGQIEYDMVFVWAREEWEEWTAEKFFEYLQSIPVRIKVCM